MDCKPDWLPDFFNCDPWCSNTYDRLYRYFCTFIRDADLKYKKHNVWISKKMEDGKEERFWHLTDKEMKRKTVPRRMRKFNNNSSSEREPDLERCKRITWINPLVTNSKHEGVLAWDYEEGNGDIKTYIWLKDYDYIIIMKKMGNKSRMLITAFYILYDSKRKEFERKYKNSI